MPQHPPMDSNYAQALLDAATDAVVVIDHQGLIETVNSATLRLFGYGQTELVGASVDMLMTSAERERHDAHQPGRHAVLQFTALLRPSLAGAMRHVTPPAVTPACGPVAHS